MTDSDDKLNAALRTIFESFPSGVSLFDAELNLVAWNRQFEIILKYPPHLFERALHMSDLLRYNALRGDYGPGDPESHVEVALARCRLMQAHEFERTTPDGVVLEVRGTPLERGGFVSTYTDITARKQAEIQYRATLTNASVGILFTRHSKVLHCNPKFAEIYGWDSPEELIGQSGSVFWLTASEYEAVGRAASPLLSAGQTFTTEQPMRRKDGSSFMGRLTAKAVDPQNTPAGTIWIGQDVTAQRAMEQALRDKSNALQTALEEQKKLVQDLAQTQEHLVRQERLAALGSLVAGVAHELNTPIGNSLLVASMLSNSVNRMEDALEKGLTRTTLRNFLDESRSAAELLERNMHRAADLVHSFKQVAVDHASEHRRQFDLAELVRETLAINQPSITQTPYVVTTDVTDNCQMDAYPGPLSQVLLNLVNNAVLHGFDGRDHGNVHIQAVTDHAARSVTLTVTDDGKGIPPDVLPRIFDPFFTTKLGKGGSGLGLHISHNLVTGPLGGQMLVNSQPGQGTTFTLVLPLCAPSAEDAAEAAATAKRKLQPPA